jgi:hypothetical protein
MTTDLRLKALRTKIQKRYGCGHASSRQRRKNVNDEIGESFLDAFYYLVGDLYSLMTGEPEDSQGGGMNMDTVNTTVDKPCNKPKLTPSCPLQRGFGRVCRSHVACEHPLGCGGARGGEQCGCVAGEEASRVGY